MASKLTAVEAAARLGVKRTTLYAYVSRGLLDRSVAPDGRSSLFDATQVDSLRNNRRRKATGEVGTVITSSITKLDEAGHRYRDQSVLALAKKKTFEEVADLLWQQEHEHSSWHLEPELWERLIRVHGAFGAKSPSIDSLRVSVSVASAHDKLRSAQTPHGFTEAGRQSILSMVHGLVCPVGPKRRTHEGVAQVLWRGLTQHARQRAARSQPARVRALEAAMILLADHGLATSTFGVRVAASVRADPYSIVSTGLGAVAGVLHGSAAGMVVRLLDRAEQVGAEVAAGELFARGERIPGFGHTIYKNRDPREKMLFELVCAGWKGDKRITVLKQLKRVIADRIEVPPNVDWPLGAMTWLGHFHAQPVSIFAVARSAGWIAHAMEEMNEQALRFRPSARYVSAQDS